MRRQSQNGIPYLQFESFPNSGRVSHAVFTRQGGTSLSPFDTLNLSVSVPDDKTHVYANRKRAYGVFGRDSDTVVHAHLVHGAEVARVTRKDHGSWVSRADGIITDDPGCGLTMNFADCTPIFIYDPLNEALGLGHAGWQGAVKNLPGAMVRRMQEEFGSNPDTLLASLGPCIGVCCYEVGEQVIRAVNDAFADSHGLLIPAASSGGGEHGRPHFDLQEANRRNLAGAGLKHIELSGFCTACRIDLFYSHRAEKGKTGRYGTIFMLT